MCLYPEKRPNPRYVIFDEHGKKIYLPVDDKRKYVIETKCGKCSDCRKENSIKYEQFLISELQYNKGISVALTFSPEELQILADELKTTDANTILETAIIRFKLRYKAKYGENPRMFLISELGSPDKRISKKGITMKNTERAHLHGILFRKDKFLATYEPTNKQHFTRLLRELNQLWKYGYVWLGDYCTSKTVGYLLKYYTKQDKYHKHYKPLIKKSNGLGENYWKSNKESRHYYKGKDTITSFVKPNGKRTELNTLWKNKIFNQQQKETLLIKKLDENTKYVNGFKFEYDNLSTEDWDKYQVILNHQRQLSFQKGEPNLFDKNFKFKNYPAANNLRLNTDDNNSKEKYNEKRN